MVAPLYDVSDRVLPTNAVGDGHTFGKDDHIEWGPGLSDFCFQVSVQILRVLLRLIAILPVEAERGSVDYLLVNEQRLSLALGDASQHLR